MSTLYTIGYQMRTLDELVELLREQGIGLLIDVRDAPWSHKPGFSKKPLAAALEPAGIEYLHAGFAGNPKSIRTSTRSNWKVLEEYGRHLDRHPYVVERLTEWIARGQDAGKRVCLICYERHPGDCHRGVLAGRWAAAGHGAVEHIAPEGCPRLVAL